LLALDFWQKHFVPVSEILRLIPIEERFIDGDHWDEGSRGLISE